VLRASQGEIRKLLTTDRTVSSHTPSPNQHRKGSTKLHYLVRIFGSCCPLEVHASDVRTVRQSYWLEPAALQIVVLVSFRRLDDPLRAFRATSAAEASALED